MSDSENLYDVLGVAKDASPSDIKKAYRRLAMLHHPDKNPDHRESSAEIFKRVGMAYQTLGDPEKRRQYDAMLLTRDTNRMPTNGYRSESNENRGFHDFSEEQAFDVFHSFFESFDRDFGFMRGFNNFEDSGFTVPSHNHSIWEDMMRDFVDYDSDRHGEGRTSTQPRGYTSRTVRITTVNGVTRKEIVTQDGEGNITKEVYSSHNNDNSPFTGAIGTVRQDGPPALGSAAGSAGAARSAEPPRAPETEQLESAVSRSGITEGEVKSKCTVDPAEMSPAKTEGGTAATARPATDEEERRKEAPAVVGKQKSVPWYSSLISRIFPCFSGGSNVDEEENHEDGRY